MTHHHEEHRRCDAFKDEGGFRLTATKFESLDDVAKNMRHNISLKPKNKEDLAKMLGLMKGDAAQGEPNSNVEIAVKMEGGFVAKVKLKPMCLGHQAVMDLQKI